MENPNESAITQARVGFGCERPEVIIEFLAKTNDVQQHAIDAQLPHPALLLAGTDRNLLVSEDANVTAPRSVKAPQTQAIHDGSQPPIYNETGCVNAQFCSPAISAVRPLAPVPPHPSTSLYAPDRDRPGATASRSLQPPPSHPRTPHQAHQAGRAKKPRKPRTYSDALPSHFCHICSRKATTSSPHVVCGNVQRGACRKVICRTCFRRYRWSLEDAQNAAPGTWLCTHCRGECPVRSQCVNYNNTSDRRRLNLVKPRKRNNSDATHCQVEVEPAKKHKSAPVASDVPPPLSAPVPAPASAAVSPGKAAAKNKRAFGSSGGYGPYCSCNTELGAALAELVAYQPCTPMSLRTNNSLETDCEKTRPPSTVSRRNDK